MLIKEALKDVTGKLAKVSESASLDASLILSKVTGYSKLELFMKDEEVLMADKITEIEALTQRRVSHEPMAYI
ncbi:MAG: hypothetical protein CFH43_00990, partial [Proteobacteria bacterium]